MFRVVCLSRYLGTVDTVHLVTENGRRMAEVAGEWKEVVVATATEVAAMPIPGLEGVYVVGTGNTGAAQAFFTLGAGYLAVIMAGAFAYRVPHEGCVVLWHFTRLCPVVGARVLTSCHAVVFDSW